MEERDELIVKIDAINNELTLASGKVVPVENVNHYAINASMDMCRAHRARKRRNARA